MKSYEIHIQYNFHQNDIDASDALIEKVGQGEWVASGGGVDGIRDIHLSYPTERKALNAVERIKALSSKKFPIDVADPVTYT